MFRAEQDTTNPTPITDADNDCDDIEEQQEEQLLFAYPISSTSYHQNGEQTNNKLMTYPASSLSSLGQLDNWYSILHPLNNYSRDTTRHQL